MMKKYAIAMIISLGLLLGETVADATKGQAIADNTSAKGQEMRMSPPEIAAFWTKSRRRNTQSRDIIVDQDTGVASIRSSDGDLVPLTGPSRPSGPPQRGLRSSSSNKAPHSKGRSLQTAVANERVALPNPPELRAVGRLFFTINGGAESSCSGTVVGGNRIVTSAHCVHDYKTGSWATNYMFIPNQDDGGSDPADRDCNNDPHGCWFPNHALVPQKYDPNNWWYYDFVSFYLSIFANICVIMDDMVTIQKIMIPYPN